MKAKGTLVAIFNRSGGCQGENSHALATRGGVSLEIGGSSGPLRGRILTLITLALSLLPLLALASSASAAPKQIVNTVGSPDLGEAGGRFNFPRGVAVNQSGAGEVPAGTFYIVDSGPSAAVNNLRVQRFGPTGAFVSTWGWGVGAGNNEFEICTKAPECRRGKEGKPEGVAGSFGNPRAIAVDQSNGNVYVSDPSASARRIDVFSAKGAFQGAFSRGIRTGSVIELEFCTTGTGCKRPPTVSFIGRGGEFPGEIGLGGLAVDAAGNVYVANGGHRRVDVFKPTLTGGVVTGVEFLRTFGWGVVDGKAEFQVCTDGPECKPGLAGVGVGQFATNSPSDVAVDSAGNVFALDAGNKRVEEFSSVPAPVTATFGSAELAAVFGAGAQLFNIAVDPSTAPNHLLVSGSRVGSGGKVAIAELDGSGSNALGAGKAHGEELTITSASGLAAAKTSIGGNLYLSTETIGALRGAYVLNEPPTVDAITNITGTTALFKGKVVSNNINVTYHFEYSTDGKTWTKVSTSDVNAGTQPGRIEVQQEAKGLTGSQLYRVRLVQNRPLGGGVFTSAEAEFTTLAAKPAIQGTVASPVKDTSATFNAYIDPQNQATAYRFEYGAADCSANPCTALPLSEANGGGLRLITQTATGLEPATLYHFRLIATNASGETKGPDGAFETFASGAQLPDDRAYELVTPPDTAAVVLNGGWGELAGRDCFDTFPATADGDSVVSMSKGGSLPGLSVNGFWDLYESVRDPENGWSTVAKSASGAQSTVIGGGLCVTPDHLYSTQATGPGDAGSLVVEGKQSNYIRHPGGVVDEACGPPSEPEGLFELIGCGSEGIDPEANARWITEKANHIVFASRGQLEPNAPPSGVQAVYDRTPGGPTQVVSLPPAGASLATEEEFEEYDAEYQGASVDGSTVAFKVGEFFEETMYARIDNTKTLKVAGVPNTFAGVSQDGESVFYANAFPVGTESSADLFVFDAATATATEIAPNSIFVNVSDDGSHVYFTSKSALTGTEKNDQGQEAKAGQNNLYVWDQVNKEVHFIAIVDPKDISGAGGAPSLTRWTGSAVSPNQTTLNGRANDPSRTTPDGSVLLFESRANITGYDSGGHIEIYRYDADAEPGKRLACVSCPPTGVPAASDARLEAPFGTPLRPVTSLVHIQNVTDDGQKVFFQTEDALVPGDVNATWDVYEWKVGQQAYLISSGHGQLPSHLYGMTPNGSDVFFTSTERLLPQDLSTVSSIYDAREGGGFPFAEPKPPCLPDGNCQGTPGSAPQLPGAGSASFQGPENEKRRSCRKNTRRVKRNGKIRCVKKHSHKAKRGHRANHNRGGAK